MTYLPQSIHLTGSEDVQNAAHTMSRAAESFARTQAWLDESLQRFVRDFAEQVDRLDALKETT